MMIEVHPNGIVVNDVPVQFAPVPEPEMDFSDLKPITTRCAKLPPEMCDDRFTDREKQIARLLAADMQTGEVAVEMKLSLARIKEHIADMNTKAGKKTRLATVAYMVDRKIIQLDE